MPAGALLSRSASWPSPGATGCCPDGSDRFERFTPAARELYDSRMQRPVARLFFALPLPVGMIAVIIGMVFLLTEA